MEIRRRQNKQLQKTEKKPRKSGSGRKPGLTLRNRAFVYYLLQDDKFDVAKAYERAGYKGEKKWMAQNAYNLLKRPEIQGEIDRIWGMRFESMEMDIYWLDHKLRQIADFDLRKCYNRDGSLKSPHEMDDDTIMALKSIETDEIWAGQGKDRAQIGVTRKISAWDKLKAHELIGKRKGMFAEKVELGGEVKVKAGVLVVPAPMSVEDWEEMTKNYYQKKSMEDKASLER